MVVALVLIWVLTYSILGFVEGLVWSKEGSEAFTWNEHIPLSIQRVLLGILGLGCAWLGFDVAWKSLVSSLPMFFFFHDGMIYLTRNLINPAVYKRKWFDESITSTATYGTMSLRWRIGLFLVGCILIVLFEFNIL